jgi:hypothetical protein
MERDKLLGGIEDGLPDLDACLDSLKVRVCEVKYC